MEHSPPKVVLVTGASRGAGRGIAIALGATGATVYVTGRTLHEGDAAPEVCPACLHPQSYFELLGENW